MTDRRRFATGGLTLALLLAAAAPVAAQSTYYWNAPTGPGALWSDPNNWWTTSTGTVSGVAPGSGDLARFNGTGADGVTTVQLNATTSALGMTFTNAGTTVLDSSSTASNALTVGAGGTTINAGAGAVTLGDAANPMPISLAAGQTWANNSANTFTVVNGVSATGAQTLSVAGSGNSLFGGALTNGSGTLALTKTGPGTLTLASASTYTGGTFVRNGPSNSFNTAGTLKLDFSNPAAPAADILANGSALTFGGSVATPAQTGVGGGVLNLTQNASTSSTQTLGTTNVGVGASGITMTSANGNTFYLSLGTLNRTAGGTLNITQPSGTVSATNGVLTSSGSAGTLLTDANGTAFATVGGTGWAAKDSTNTFITALTGYTPFSASGPISGDADVTGNGTATSDSTFNSVRFISTAARTLTLAGTNTITAGGVLVGSGSTAASTITGGTIRAGAGRELVFINNANLTAGALAINSVIADSASGQSTVTYRSLTATTTTGLVTIGANNTYTGDTYITAGRVSVAVAGNTPLGNGGNVYINGNTNGQFAMFNGAAGTVANHFYIIGNGWSEAGGPYGALRVDAGTVSGTVTLLGDAAIGAQTVANGTISGTIEGAFNLTKLGSQKLTLTGTNTYSGTTTISASTLQIGNAGATGTLGDGTGAVINNAGLTISRTNAYALANAISGTGSLTVSGTGGVVTLTGANTYTGATAVNAGTLALGAAGGVGTGLGNTAVTVASGATFGVQPGLSGASGGATNALSGSLTLNAGSTYTMADGVTSTFNVGGTATLAPATGTSPALQFELGAANEAADKLALTGTATVGAATATLVLVPLATPSSPSNTYTLITAGGGLGTNFTLGGVNNYVIGGSPYHAVLTNSTATSQVVSFDAGVVTPTTAYWTGSTNGSWSTQNGDSSTNFASDAAGQSNTYALPDGTTVVVVSANSASNLSTMTVDGVSAVKGITFTGAGTSNTAGATIAAGTATSLTVNGGGVTVSAGSGANTVSAPITLGAAQNWTNNSTGLLTVQGNVTNSTFLLTVAGTGNTTISGGIGGSGGLTMSGAGVLTLAGNNTYTGTTTVTAGTLKIGSPIALNAANNVTLSGTGTLDLNGNSVTIGSLTDASTNTITNSSTSTAASTATTAGTPSGAGVSVDALTVGTVTTAGSIPAKITDGSTRKTQVVVSNNNLSTTGAPLTNTANTFSGGLVLAYNATGGPNGTRLALNSAATINALGTGPVIIGQSATDKAGIWFSTAANLTLPRPVVFNTGLGTDRVGIRVDFAGETLSGVVTANVDAVFSANTTGGAVTLTNQVTGAGGLALDVSQTTTANTALTMTLNNATANPNNYQGDTVVGRVTGGSVQNYAAALRLGRADQIPNGAGFGNVVLTNGTATQTGTLNLNGFNETVNGLSGSGTVDGGSGSPVFQVGDNNANGTFTGVLKNTAGTLALTKIGVGTQTLTGANTYAGPTTINGGTLRVNGSLAAGSAVVVNSGGTIGGTGTINGPLTVNAGGILDPGASVGTLTVANSVTINGGTGTQWNVELNGTAPTNADNLNVTGAANTLNFVTAQPSDKITINLVDLVGLPANTPLTYNIASVAPGTGATNILSNGTTPFDPTQFMFIGVTGSGFSISQVGDVIQVGFTTVPVPEPAFVLAACGAGAAGLSWLRRRSAGRKMGV